MDNPSRKAVQGAIMGTLGCAVIIGIAGMAVNWISEGVDPESPPTEAGRQESVRSDSKVGNEEGTIPSSAGQSQASSDEALLNKAVDDTVLERLNGLGYRQDGSLPSWMPKYPQVLSPKKLWSSILTDQKLEEGSQVILCHTQLSTSHLWDPFNSSPDPEMRILHQNQEILHHRQIGTHHAMFSAFQSDFAPGGIISLEISEFDALNKNDYVGSWSFIIEDGAFYRHQGRLYESECAFVSPMIAQEAAKVITQKLDLSSLSSKVDLAKPNFGFPIETYKHTTRQIEGLAALVGLTNPDVRALLNQDTLFIQNWLAQLLPHMRTAARKWPRFQDLKFDGWRVSLSELSCDAAPFCHLVLTLTSLKAVDLSLLHHETPLRVSFFDGLGVEHGLREPKFYHNGEMIGEYELRHRSVPLNRKSTIEAHFELDCTNCEQQAKAIREDVQLVRFHMFEQNQSSLVSLRKE
ncbi:MAG: hypothetical protein VX026_00060 [Myxococcota bacterium]|nr:hypothetical protein [Myxococcota bacterium]